MTLAGGPDRILEVDTLERFELILLERGWSGAEWARRAGLKEPTHVTTYMARLRANPEATLDLRTAALLADAAGVSLDWLALGRGTQHGAVIIAEDDAVYPSRAIAVAAAKISGFRADAIDKVAKVDGFAVDPGLEYWLALLRAEHAAGGKLLPTGPKRSPKRLAARKRR